jgi:RNA:NAD 2'-phosphotransferase (TPT1/KptA family)
MSKTYVTVLKKNAIIQVPFTTDDISQLHSILLRHLDDQCKLDDRSWATIESLCGKIDRYAENQNQTESKEVNF